MKPTIEEMVELIKAINFGLLTQQDIVVRDALERLILAVGEWKREAQGIPVEGHDLKSLVNSIGLSLKLIQQLRDFGEEGK